MTHLTKGFFFFFLISLSLAFSLFFLHFPVNRCVLFFALLQSQTCHSGCNDGIIHRALTAVSLTSNVLTGCCWWIVAHTPRLMFAVGLSHNAAQLPFFVLFFLLSVEARKRLILEMNQQPHLQNKYWQTMNMLTSLCWSFPFICVCFSTCCRDTAVFTCSCLI